MGTGGVDPQGGGGAARGPALHVLPTPEAVAEALAERLVGALACNPALVMALPTGRTPLALYRRLVALHGEGRVSFARASVFQLDEFLGLEPDDPARFAAYLERHLLRHVDVASARVHRLDGAAPDAEAECARYETALEAAGGLDVALLGIGDNGHVAFNEPGPALQARAHVARLTRQTREANAGLFGGEPARVPTHALTLGMSALLQAREVHLVATGAAKAEVVRAALQGPVTPLLPASHLQVHPCLEVWLDAAAARLT
jgi:glucosamine-6-phosphate deaminase